jgi:hypothetical protein
VPGVAGGYRSDLADHPDERGRRRLLTINSGPGTVRTRRRCRSSEDGGVYPTQVAEWAGHSVDVLLRIYAKCVVGQDVIDANPRPSPRHGTVPAGAQVVLDQLAAYGPGGQVREQLELWGRAADIVALMLPPGLPWPAIEATLRAAAPGTGRPPHGPHGDSTRSTYPLAEVQIGANRARPTGGGHGAADLPAGLRERASAEGSG